MEGRGRYGVVLEFAPYPQWGDFAMTPVRGNEELSVVDQDLGARLVSQKHPKSPPCLSGPTWVRTARSGRNKNCRA